MVLARHRQQRILSEGSASVKEDCSCDEEESGSPVPALSQYPSVQSTPNPAPLCKAANAWQGFVSRDTLAWLIINENLRNYQDAFFLSPIDSYIERYWRDGAGGGFCILGTYNM